MLSLRALWAVMVCCGLLSVQGSLAADCNYNGIEDSQYIAAGTSKDGSGVPDEYDSDNPEVSLDLVCQSGGATKAVAISGDYAYMGTGPRVVVFDLSQPLAPTPVGQTAPLNGVVRDLAVSGNHALVISGTSDVVVIDISNPSSPVAVASLQMGYYTRAIAVSGNHAYVVGDFDLEEAGMAIIDITYPTEPVWVGTFSQTVTLGDYFGDIVVSGSYAYLGCSDGLRIVDVSNPTAPVAVSSPPSSPPVSNAPQVFCIDLSGDHVYFSYSVYEAVCDPESGECWDDWVPHFDVIDVSNPASPVRISSSSLAVSALAIAGTNLYLSSGTDLRLSDITSPAAPILKKIGYGFPSAGGMAIAGNTVYLAHGLGLTAVDRASFESIGEVAASDTPGSAEQAVIN